MKKIFLCLLIAVLCLSGCASSSGSGEASDVQEENPLICKIYGLNKNSQNNEFDFDWMAFYNDNTFRGVFNNWKLNRETGVRTDNYRTTYGTYSLDGNSLTMTVGKDNYSCVVLDNGNEIMIGDVGWLDFSDGQFSDDFLSAISQ